MPRRNSKAERGLELLRGETNRAILAALRRSPSTEAELTAWLVLRTRGKLRRHLDTLLAAGAIESRRLRGNQRRVEYRLTEIGQGLVAVIYGVERWLCGHPDRPLESVSPVGWRAFALLVDAWTVGLIQELARGPKQLVELAATTGVSPARLGDDLLALEGAGVAATGGATTSRPTYFLTAWGIRGIGVLALGAHWQRRIGDRAAPITVEDALSALRVSLTLAQLPEEVSGSCAVTVELDGGGHDGRRMGGLRVEIRRGRIEVTVATAGQGPAEAWVRGTIEGWLKAAVGGRVGALRIGGREKLARDLLLALQSAIYGPAT